MSLDMKKGQKDLYKLARQTKMSRKGCEAD